MSMMECAHCKRAADARSMACCDRCGAMICEECARADGDCPDEDDESTPRAPR